MSGQGQPAGAILKPLITKPDDPKSCWSWRGRVDPTTGYGAKQSGGRKQLAHRWVYALFHGPIAPGLTINHLCRNRACVNPYHLEAVTQAENCRHGAGTKLTHEAAAAIKHHPYRSRKEKLRLAKANGVSPQLVGDIWAGRAWRDQ